MPEKSCLTCLHGKPEKQEQGYYCESPDVCRIKTVKYWAESGDVDNCWKPRPNQCELDGCKWSGKHEGEDFCYQDDDLKVGAICERFDKEETEPMEKFKFEEKTYEQTNKLIDFKRLKEDADGISCVVKIISEFASDFGLIQQAIVYTQTIFDITSEMIDWATKKHEIIPWLVEKGYLVEVVKEETYSPPQWFKDNSGDYHILVVSRVDRKFFAGLVGIKTAGNNAYANFHPVESINISRSELDTITGTSNKKLTPVPPPTITETPDKAERSRMPERCIHNGKKHFRRCTNSEAKTYFKMSDEVFCDNQEKCSACPAYFEE